MRPARQGDLDGFCALYAVVNAVSLLDGLRPKPSLRRALFRELGTPWEPLAFSPP
jgi:hypothetical protein